MMGEEDLDFDEDEDLGSAEEDKVDVVELLLKMRQQLVYLEKKIDALIAQSASRSSERPSYGRPEKRGFDKPFHKKPYGEKKFFEGGNREGGRYEGKRRDDSRREGGFNREERKFSKKDKFSKGGGSKFSGQKPKFNDMPSFAKKKKFGNSR